MYTGLETGHARIEFIDHLCRHLANREILHKIRKRVKGKVFSAAIIMIISEKSQ